MTPDDLGSLQNRRIGTSARRITRYGYESCGATLAPSGSLVISTRAPIGHTGILDVAACANQGCRLLIPNDTIQSVFLYYLLEVAKPELKSLGQGTTFTELSRGKLAALHIPLPPLPEQVAIVRFLDHADRRIQHRMLAATKQNRVAERTETSRRPTGSHGGHQRPNRQARTRRPGTPESSGWVECPSTGNNDPSAQLPKS